MYNFLLCLFVFEYIYFYINIRKNLRDQYLKKKEKINNNLLKIIY